MPELPEVETTVTSLKKKVLKKAFVRVWTEKGDGVDKVKGKRINEIERIGKGIFFFLSDGNILFVHLRMTGHFLFGRWEFLKKEKEWHSKNKVLQEKKNGFLRYVFFLDDGNQIALSDPRKFAKVLLFSKKEFEEYKTKIGPDPLSIEEKNFIELIKEKRREIKPLLMDQSVISGIGNIYAAETLFKAKINPSKKAHLLSDKELKEIYFFMQETLKKAIGLKGDSTSDYRLLDGRKGGYQHQHLVYNRKDEECFVCKEKITRKVVGGRGTYYCPQCQK